MRWIVTAALIVGATACGEQSNSASPRTAATWEELLANVKSAYQAEVDSENWLDRAEMARTEAWASECIRRSTAASSQMDLEWARAESTWKNARRLSGFAFYETQVDHLRRLGERASSQQAAADNLRALNLAGEAFMKDVDRTRAREAELRETFLLGN